MIARKSFLCGCGINHFEQGLSVAVSPDKKRRIGLRGSDSTRRYPRSAVTTGKLLRRPVICALNYLKHMGGQSGREPRCQMCASADHAD